MKIKKLIVVDEDGNHHSWEGEGHVTGPRSSNYHPGPIEVGVSALITWRVSEPAKKEK